MEPVDAIQHYVEAWGDVDDGRRGELLEAAWAQDGTYCDPLDSVSGREAVQRHIAGFADRMPGHTIVMTSGVDAHDGFARFGWQIKQADGSVLVDGVDFVTFAPDGRISRVVGFFGPMPPAGLPE